MGFALFMLVALTAWFTCFRLARRAAKIEELRWLSDLARLMQVCLVSFAVGGLFLNKALFDLAYYYLIAIAAMEYLYRKHVAEHAPAPRVFAAEVARLLRPKGVFVADCPNRYGVTLRLIGQRAYVVMPPEHVTYFCHRSLRRRRTWR